MKVLIFCILLLLSLTSYNQSVKKYPIGNSGCAAYMFCNPGNFAISYSEDSSKVFTGRCVKDSFEYGIICVQLKDTIDEKDIAENLLESYLDFLKTRFAVREATGYGKGMKLKDREDIAGIIDYWQDEEKNHWSIQGWTDGKIIAVLYVKGNELPDYNKQQLFFKGFRFQGMM
jgi:hypothetical protein